ncbi:MAG: head GIN domain-containing protein [Bacteroidota bacterium]
MKTFLPKRFGFLVAIIGFVGLTSCEDQEFCRNGRGPIEVQEFDLDSFQGIHLKRDARVFVSQGDEQRIQVEAQDNVFEELDLKVRNGILIIDLDRCFFDYEMDVFLTITEPLTDLILTGSGNIDGEGQLLAADRLNLEISGSGDIRVNLDAVDIDSRISGSGAMRLSGIAERHDIQISGSGDVRSFDLSTRDCDIRISGSGGAEVFVDGGFLDVSITGSGDVRYKGSPSDIDSSISGSGNLINAN